MPNIARHIDFTGANPTPEPTDPYHKHFGFIPALSATDAATMLAALTAVNAGSIWYDSTEKVHKSFDGTYGRNIGARNKFIGAEAFQLVAGSPASGLNAGAIPIFAMDKAAVESVGANVFVKDVLDPGSALNVYVFYSTTATHVSTASSTSTWRVKYRSLAEGESVTATISSITKADDMSSGPNVVNVTAAFTIPAANIAADDLLFIQVDRVGDDGDDKLDADAQFIGVRITNA